MRKGVSPVVATVLLIAIAVISAVAVWYWVAPLTAAQPTSSTAQYAFVPTTVYKNTTSDGCWSLDIMNSGGVSIAANTIFEVKLQSNGSGLAPVTYVNVTAAISPGTTRLFNTSSGTNASNRTSVPLGTYILRASSTLSASSVSGFSDVYFTC